MTTKVLPPVLPARASRLSWAVAGVCIFLVGLFCAQLWPEWRQNPDLSHGFFAPLVFLILLWEGRQQGPHRWVPAKGWSALVVAGLVMASLVIFALAGLFAATLAWSHALVLFLLAVAMIAFLSGGLVLLADERVRLVPFNWISLTALLLWLLVAPIPDGTYARLTLGLQTWVTNNVMHVLHLLGIPARQHGNVIELARATVGVEEACSGVRSLISCVYAGFFFAAWQVRRTGRRLLLIGISVVMALGMNLLRSLSLTLLANAGVKIAGTWHDLTGYAILGVTAASLAGLAIMLESKQLPARAPSDPVNSSPVPTGRSGYAVFGVGTVLAGVLGLFFFLHSRPRDIVPTPPPQLAALLPASAPGWEIQDSPDLYQFSGILQTSHLMQRTYWRTDATGQRIQLTVYIAYWAVGQASVSRVASHTPDACWPGSGWTNETAEGYRRQTLSVSGHTVAPAEYRLFRTTSGYAQHVWFWHVFAGRAIDYQDPYSIPALLRIALKYGFSRQGSQYFVRISSNRPWSELAKDPLSSEILNHLAHTGI
jgi:exosortase